MKKKYLEQYNLFTNEIERIALKKKALTNKEKQIPTLWDHIVRPKIEVKNLIKGR